MINQKKEERKYTFVQYEDARNPLLGQHRFSTIPELTFFNPSPIDTSKPAFS
jgi:hypothetical protein